MSLTDPQTARDININALGRMEIYRDEANTDQLVYRFIAARLRTSLGKKVPVYGLENFVRAEVFSISEDLVALQSAAPNFRRYKSSELVASVDLMSIQMDSPAEITVKLKVFLQSGIAFDTSVGVLR